jgi:methylmalonyl-CoA mutase
MTIPQPYKPKHPVRMVTAASLFDGHDASINIIRRMLQDSGVEVIHLGHNRSVQDVVTAAIQESAQGICISSYQGGHMEYFKFMKDSLEAFGAGYVKIYGGGGGVIVHEEKAELEAYGISQIFHPDDGRRLGLQGMIDVIVQGCDFDVLEAAEKNQSLKKASRESGAQDQVLRLEKDRQEKSRQIGLLITAAELGLGLAPAKPEVRVPILGVTGTGGAGKSSLVDELVLRFLNTYPEKSVAVLCVDPTKRRTGGALLGDRIRMNSVSRPRTYMRSIASRGSGKEVSTTLPSSIAIAQASGFDLVIVETSGIGQADAAITDFSDVALYVMTSEFGAQSQLEKIDMIDFADLIAINKADRRGARDALRDVRKQYRRSRQLFHEPADDVLPVHLTQASHFNDEGVSQLFVGVAQKLSAKTGDVSWLSPELLKLGNKKSEVEVGKGLTHVIPPERVNYLAEIVSTVRDYKQKTKELSEKASLLGAITSVQAHVAKQKSDSKLQIDALEKEKECIKSSIPAEDLQGLQAWDETAESYNKTELVYKVRDREIRQPLVKTSLSGSSIRRVVYPKMSDWGDRVRFLRLENVPGSFPFTAGVFPLKRNEEDPRRQFAGEGSPERTNARFHFLSQNDSAKRLSTAFDSVTLYGEDPDPRPDIYGKVGESGVSICTLDDMKTLYKGFDLCSPSTSVSMTINGPAPIILAFFMNAAIDQQVDQKESKLGRQLTLEEWNQTYKDTIQQVRGTVQADILKEDQAQNTCIFSIDFALKMMGDIQEFFIEKQIRNFYSVSISGYHIAEAGANPISQTAFTLANGFTYVEYYRSRGMRVDDFAPNLSFFFSNGLDAEYAVIGRVARRIWAIAMRDLYGASDRSQKLKYHIQTSGRSLHAQEIAFNDIRTTLQALLALYDNCNSLHTNAYDEAITTPTEESVRRAMAIQMIINREFGVAQNENPNQGSYFLEELTDLVEEAVLNEFLRLNERGGVLGAMETQYQRSKIQDESLYYERLKHSGELPVIGVNTFVDPKTLEANYLPPKIEMARASSDEKQLQLKRVRIYRDTHSVKSTQALEKLKSTALAGGNIFTALMEASRVCTLGQMSGALYEAGGQYRRNI